MVIYSHNENGEIVSADVVDAELNAIGCLDLLLAGEVAFYESRWLIPNEVNTTHGLVNHTTLTFWQGVDLSNGEHGSCDAFYLCARLNNELVKRAVNIRAHGIQMDLKDLING